MRTYLAASYSRRNELLGYARDLEALDHQVKARWLAGDHEATNEQLLTDPGLPMRFAHEDIEDIFNANAVICFTQEPGSSPRNRGGRHVEFGIVLGLKCATQTMGRVRLIVVGPVENVFYSLPWFERYATWEECRAALVKEVDP